MPKKNSHQDAVGIYLRKRTYWFKQTIDGERFYHNLEVHTLPEAIAKAKPLRGVRPTGKPRVGEWDKAIAKYLVEKKAGHKPAHLAGKRLRSFRNATTAGKVKSCLEVFSRTCGATSPSTVTTKQLQAYYDARAKKSKAGARSTIATVQAFLDYIQCLPGRVVIPVDHKPEARRAVLSIEASNVWIDEAPDDRLRYVLFCGFHAGLRKGEIMHSRTKWFDLDREILTIPGKEEMTLPTGRRIIWQNKDSDTREIPLTPPFVEFLQKFLAEPKRDFALPSIRKSAKASSTGLYDFRAPFEAFAAKKGRPDLTIHGMRHSWFTELCNSGNHEITDIASWSGDTIETIENNYWKRKARKGALNETMKGKRKGQEQEALVRQMAAQIEDLVKAGKIDEGTAKEIWKGFETEEEERGMNERWAEEDERRF